MLLPRSATPSEANYPTRHLGLSDLMRTKIDTSLSVSIVLYNSPAEQLNTLLESLSSAIERLYDHYSMGVTPIYLLDNSDQAIFELEDIKNKNVAFKKNQIILSQIRGHGNIGYGRAHNLVLSELVSDFHLILNPDVILEEDALLRALDILINDRSVVMLSPNAKNPLGNKLHLCKRYPSVLIFFIRGIVSSSTKNLW